MLLKYPLIQFPEKSFRMTAGSICFTKMVLVKRFIVKSMLYFDVFMTNEITIHH